jgi:cold shock CspA family protein/CRISPR/Cas system CSM-associated protein Csm3 (group 7 of RAMP superfamily)
MSDTAPIDRWILSGRLITRSVLEIRTGDTETDQSRPDGKEPGHGEPPKDKVKDENPGILAIDLDANRQPVIPATAMKGRVRAILAEDFGDSQIEAIIRLLGDRPDKRRNPNAPDAQVAQGGSAEFHNLRIVQPDGPAAHRPPVLGKAAIHAGTGTAANRLLRHSRVVPEETVFVFEITVGGAAEDDVALLCHALGRFDGAHDSALGGRKRTGQGRIRLVPGSLLVRRLDIDGIRAWLKDGSDAQWTAHARIVDPPAAPIPRPTAPLPVPLTLAVDGFFLVTGEQPKKKARADGSEEQEAEPRKPRVLRRGGKDYPLLPGESLNGVLRAQAMRIWRTLTGKPDTLEGANIPGPVAELFGSTERRGRLNISDCIGRDPQPLRVHEMVAIDRFHGASSGSQKFNVLAFEAPILCGELRLAAAARGNIRATGKESRADPRLAAALSCEAFGLFALLFRDLAEGELAAGFGTRKGYGRLSLPGDWQQTLIGLAAGLPLDCDPAAGNPTERGRARIARSVAALRAACVRTEGRTDAVPPANAPEPDANPPKPVAQPDSFLNAYHFVPVEDGVAPPGPDGSLDIAYARTDTFGHTPDTARDGHAIYLDGTWSGRVTCRLTTLQPLIVGDRRYAGDSEEDKRKYAVLKPFLLNGEPAIPATSLKGMISAIVESVSGSALRVLDDVTLAVRAGHGKSARRTPLALGSVYPLFTAGSDDRANLLPMAEHRTLITPAERLFGFVPADAPEEKNKDTRIRALAGRLRFSHARLDPAGSGQYLPNPDYKGEAYEGEIVGAGYQRLRELSGPLKDAKPPDGMKNASAALYYRRPGGAAGLIPRDDLVRARPGEVLPQGRKFYLHHAPAGEPWRTMATEEEDRASDPAAGPAASRKTAAKLLARGQDFVFEIAFDNLSAYELGLLLFALKPSRGFRHKLGLGKPIGLGSVEVKPEALHIVDRRRRYAEDDPLSGAQPRDMTASIGAFIAEARQAIARQSPQAVAALLAIGETHGFGGGRPSPMPVVPVPLTHAQFEPVKKGGPIPESETFAWFQTNTRAEGRDGQSLEPIVGDRKAAERALKAGGAMIPPLLANVPHSRPHAQRASPAAPAVTQQHRPAPLPALACTGTVKWFNLAKGYGFIMPDDGGKDVFVHITALQAAGIARLPDGTRVAFGLERQGDRINAVGIRLL